MTTTALIPLPAEPAELMPAGDRGSLAAWFSLYMRIEAAANADNTAQAKRRDLQRFLIWFTDGTGTGDAGQWTRSITTGFLEALDDAGMSATTINRALASLRHCSAWIHHQRPFLAGDPCDRICELDIDDPVWRGLQGIEVIRLKSSAEQLLHLRRRKNQQPLRDYAIFMVLLHTGLRVSEMLRLDLADYRGKHFHQVKRKGKKVSRRIFVAKDARGILDLYITDIRGPEPGPLFCSSAGRRLARQNVDTALKAIADQSNAKLPDDQKIQLSAHVLRHTMLRKVAEKRGVRYAMEVSGHTSSQYIWRYVKPSKREKESALDHLF